jgi:orotate phosphoribosyltransferase
MAALTTTPPEFFNRPECVALIRDRALRTGVKVTLASGQVSDTYVDSKQITLHGPSLRQLARWMTDLLERQSPKPTVIAGVSIGGDPLVASVIVEAAARGWSVTGLLIRKEAKGHGTSTGKRLEGPVPAKDAVIWLLEDVVSTGGSALSAISALSEAGYKLAGALCLLDREMGGVQLLSTAIQAPVLPLATLSAVKPAG